jgi:hypothetical protein
VCIWIIFEINNIMLKTFSEQGIFKLLHSFDIPLF